MKSRKKNFRILLNILRRTDLDRVLLVYIIFVFISAAILNSVEPNIKNYGDSLWYSFSVLTTIGFGDITVSTGAGKILTILLSIYSILIIAMIPGVITSFYTEILKVQSRDSIEEFMTDLEHLPELSRQELAELSEKVVKFRKKHSS